jgi:hypothetical protein
MPKNAPLNLNTPNRNIRAPAMPAHEPVLTPTLPTPIAHTP